MERKFDLLKKGIVTGAIAFFYMGAFAQDSTANESCVEPSMGADVVSRYVWRGQDLSTSPAIQPGVGISFAGFELGAWGSYSFAPISTEAEVDLFLSYTTGSITIGINDYYNPYNDSTTNNYFDWKNADTKHSLEPFITLSEIAGTPFSITGGAFIYGNDKDDNEDNAYSSYVELGYSKNIGDYECTLYSGATLNGSYYADGFAFVNVGASVSKELKITPDFSIPCNGSFIVNPEAKNVFFVFGMSF